MDSIVPYSNTDTEKLYVCPYDNGHVVRAFKFNQHLRKCRKNHGGQGFEICSFNQSHHVPSSQIEHHLITCPDRHVISQDVLAAQGMQKHVLPEINYHPERIKPDSTEDWDAEYEEHQASQTVEYIEPDHAEEVIDQEMDINLDNLLSERPMNWDQMTATQKKNYRRKYNKQQEKMQSMGLTPEDLKKSENPEDWTEVDRDAKLKAILSLYPPPNNKINSEFIDYKSVLNCYCQKNKINAPKYTEVSNGSMFGGFQVQVTVQGKEYIGRDRSKTKKDAGHSAAKWALLALKLPEEEKAFHRPRPIKAIEDVHSLRSAHELALLQSQGQLPPGRSNGSVPQAARQPVNGVQNDGWNTVGTRRGRGRGTALAGF